jgi:predicted dehydrogenase
MSTSTIAVLGTAHFHIVQLTRLARKVPGAQLLGVYDDDADRRAKAVKDLELEATADLDALLSRKPKLVLIGAVPSDRANLAARAVEAGATVLVDKPLAITADALKHVRAAQERTGKPVIVFYPYRGYPLIRAARSVIESGRIGKVVRIFAAGPHFLNPPSRSPWHFGRETNGDILIDTASHSLDLCCWLTGQRPSLVSASVGNYANPEHKEFTDFGHAMLRFPRGEVAYVEVDWLVSASIRRGPDTRVWIQGTKGKIEIRWGLETTAFITTDDAAAEPLKPEGADVDAWTVTLMQDLLAGRTCEIPQADVWQASEVCLAASRAAREGQTVRL